MTKNSEHDEPWQRNEGLVRTPLLSSALDQSSSKQGVKEEANVEDIQRKKRMESGIARELETENVALKISFE